MYGITKPVDIPFEIHNNFIVIPVLFNRTLPLNFIYDTGAEHTVLMKREVAEIMKIPFERRLQIIGSDMRRELFVYLVREVHLKIGAINIPNQSLLVLEEDYFRFDEMAGLNVQGIIGADVFRGYRVEIDYRNRRLTISPSSNKTPGKRFREIPVEIYKNKPYFETDVLLSDTTNAEVKLLIDTGSNLPLILYTDTHPDLDVPENVVTGAVASGLGGSLEGVTGRVDKLPLHETGFKLNEVTTSFQELIIDLDTTRLNGRNGIIGNPALRRFDVVIDYPRSQFFVRPNKYYKEEFEYDKSGLILIAGGASLNQIYVSKVVPGSPAAEAGIFRGDRIVKINGIGTAFTSLTAILKKLKKKEGKKIKLVLRRRNVKMKRTFRLRELI